MADLVEKDRYKLTMLGSMSLIVGGTPAALPQSKKTRALLAYLALNPKEHRRERLCDLFWEMPDDPRAALRWSLSKLRTLLNTPEKDRIVANRETVALDSGDLAVDVKEIHDSLSGSDSLTVGSLETIAGRFDGRFLEGLELPRQPEYQAWLVAERGAMEKLHIGLLDRILGHHQDDPEKALPHARQLAMMDPHNEARHAALLKLLKAAGHHQEADDHHQVAKSLLTDAGQADSVALRNALDTAVRPDLEQETSMLRAPSAPQSHLHQDIRYCQAEDGTNIAFSTVGSGPPLVKAANWLNHLEFEWKSPVWRHWIEEFSQDHTLIRYDERGNGLSDWEITEFSLEKYVSDLETVVDTAGAERFPLLGISQGSPVAVTYALRHPERVSKLVLFGGYAKGWRVRSSKKMKESAEASMLLMRTGWGRDNPAFRQMFTSMFFPDASVEQMNWLNALQKNTTSPENAANFMSSFGDIDVADLLPQLTIPTLVLHSRHDALVSFKAGRELAQTIPNARFVPLDSNNHLLLEDEPAWARFVQEVRGFLAED